mmetsp:Transcript_34108/g.61492  ORF Transcript_34108/g.61492 Transcript_34108/m.61492 type:complete len:458 (-) Transcript_34108:462-1835(-)
MGIRLKVNLSQLGSGLAIEDTIHLFCADGEQILQWVGYACCSRLAYKRGEAHGRFVPQSIVTKEGQPLDIDIVVNEIFGDGDELFVEYSSGPTAYRVRWEGRPRTPPFRWGDGVEVLPAHDLWLTDLNLKAEGILNLVDPDLYKADPSIAEADLDKVKQYLLQYAGALQMIFWIQSSDGASSGEQLGQLTLPQFRSLMQMAKVISSRLPPEKVDEVFTTVATSENTLARKVESKSGVSSFDIVDFMLAIVQVASHRFTAENPNQAAYTHLSVKVGSLFKECLGLSTFSDLQKKLERFRPALLNSNAMLLLKKGKKLTEQTLDSCQLKRSRGSEVHVDLKWLCNHLTRWGLLGREVTLPELALIAVFAKQKTAEPESFILHEQPLEFDYAEFERLLLGIAWHTYSGKKKAGQQGGNSTNEILFEEYLGETLDSIYKKAGVLVAAPRREDLEEGDAEQD